MDAVAGWRERDRGRTFSGKTSKLHEIKRERAQPGLLYRLTLDLLAFARETSLILCNNLAPIRCAAEKARLDSRKGFYQITQFFASMRKKNATPLRWPVLSTGKRLSELGEDNEKQTQCSPGRLCGRGI